MHGETVKTILLPDTWCVILCAPRCQYYISALYLRVYLMLIHVHMSGRNCCSYRDRLSRRTYVRADRHTHMYVEVVVYNNVDQSDGGGIIIFPSFLGLIRANLVWRIEKRRRKKKRERMEEEEERRRGRKWRLSSCLPAAIVRLCRAIALESLILFCFFPSLLHCEERKEGRKTERQKKSLMLRTSIVQME